MGQCCMVGNDGTETTDILSVAIGMVMLHRLVLAFFHGGECVLSEEM